MEHLQQALKEVVSASELVLKNPGAIDLLEQACELLELANSAVNDRSISALTYKLKSNIVAFINVVAINGDYGDIQCCFQELLNSCAMLEDMCLSETSETSETSKEIQSDHEPIRSINGEDPGIDFGQDALHCLQRQILGLDDENDRTHLQKLGISKSKPSYDKPREVSVEQKDATDQACQEEQSDHHHDHISVWLHVIETTRSSMSDQSNDGFVDNGTVQSSRMLGTESDDADMVGDLGQFLNGVVSSLEKELDKLRALENAKRLPAFARRDAVIAIRAQLDDIRTRGSQCMSELTQLVANDVLSLLNGSKSVSAVCDALEALAIAWRSMSPHRQSIKVDRNKGKFEQESPIYEARRLIDVALSSVQANSRRRRVAMASAVMKKQSINSVDSWSSEGSQAGLGSKKFDVYARKPSRKVGEAAREIGRQRKRLEEGSIQLSRHCEYEPSFSDVSGLAVGSSQVAIYQPKREGWKSDRQPLRASSLNTSSMFRASDVQQKKWVLSKDSVGPTSSPSSGSDNADMSALLQYQKRLSVSIPRGRAVDSKQVVSLVSPQLTL